MSFGWKISFSSLPALPCPSSHPWPVPFSHGYQPAQGCERDARQCGVAPSHRILSFPCAASPLPLRCCPVGGMQPPTSVLYKLYFSFRVLIAKTHALGKEVAGPIALSAKQTLPRCALKGSGVTPRAHPSSWSCPCSTTELSCGGVADPQRLVWPQPLAPHWFPWASW